MAAGSYVVTALAAVGAAVGGLAVIGTSDAESPAVSPVNCVTSVSGVLDRAEAAGEVDESADCRTADGESLDGSGTLASRARAGSNDSGSNNSGSNNTARQSADDLAQALADALAGSTDADALRIAAALADAGYLATGSSAASEQDEAIGDSEDTEDTDDTGLSTRARRSSRDDDSGGSEGVSSSARSGVDRAESRSDETSFETIASVLERTSQGRG